MKTETRIGRFTRWQLHALLLAALLPVFAYAGYLVSTIGGFLGLFLGVFSESFGGPSGQTAQLSRLFELGGFIVGAFAWLVCAALSTLGVAVTQSARSVLIVHAAVLFIGTPALTWAAGKLGLLRWIVGSLL